MRERIVVVVVNVQTVYQVATVHRVQRRVLIVVLVHMQPTVAPPLVRHVHQVLILLSLELMMCLCALIVLKEHTPQQDLRTVWSVHQVPHQVLVPEHALHVQVEDTPLME